MQFVDKLSPQEMALALEAYFQKMKEEIDIPDGDREALARILGVVVLVARTRRLVEMADLVDERWDD